MLKLKQIKENIMAPGFWGRTREFWKYYLKGLLKRADEHHLFLSGAGIAFSLLLSFIPFILVVFSLFNSLIRKDIIELFINRWVDAIIPYSEYSEFVKRALLNRLPDVIAYKSWAGWFGIIGFIFSASTLFSGMRTILNRIHGGTYGRSAIFGLLRDMWMVVILLFFVLLSTFAVPMYDVITQSAENLTILQYYNIVGVYGFFANLISLGLVFVMFYLVYALIPYEKLGGIVPAVGALWATVFWEISRNIFAYYARNFISTNKLYGAFGLIVVILFWVYFLSMIFLIGAEIAQLYRERKAKTALKTVKK